MNNSNNSDNTPNQQAQLNQIVLDYMKEKKSRRRWRIVFRIVIGLLILFMLSQLFYANYKEQKKLLKPHVGVIDLKGTIADEEEGGADNLVKGLDKAYKSKGLRAVVIRINSPGGSPVQAEYMYNALRYYESKYPKIKVYAVCVDLCASAAYYVASAANQIYASPASLVGSIGVLYNGFGFVDSLQKLGVSRRLITSGSQKGFLDPFSPVQPDQVQKLKVMLDVIHQQFIHRVKEGRGQRLSDNPDLFTGLFWTGEQALPLGLIDGFGSTGQVVRDVIKLKETVDYTYKQNVFDRFAQNLGSAMVGQIPKALGMKPGLY